MITVGIKKNMNAIVVIFLDSFQLNRDCHWLILGHVALTKIKCILIVIH